MTVRAMVRCIRRIGVSHGTGPRVSARPAAEFEDRFVFCSVGTAIEAENVSVGPVWLCLWVRDITYLHHEGVMNVRSRP